MKNSSVDINLDKKPKKLEFYRLSESSTYYINSKMINPLLCVRCGCIVGSKLDHTKFHNDVEDEQFQPVVTNPVMRRGPNALLQKV